MTRRRQWLLAAWFGFMGAGCLAIMDFSDYDTRAVDDQVPPNPSTDGAPSDARITIEAAANGAFALSADTDVSVMAGQSVPVTITLGRVDNFNDAVLLQTSSPDPDVTVSLADSLLTDKSTTLLTIVAGGNAPPKDVDVVVRGTAGTLEANATVHVHVRPPAGSVDGTFGDAGTATTDPLDSSLTAMAVGADGSLYFAGTLPKTTPIKALIVKAKPNGTLDETFGTKGVLSFALGSFNMQVKGIVVLDNGAVMVSAREAASPANSYVIRTTPGGALDSNFGNGGAALITEDLRLDYTTTFDLALGADGKSYVLMGTLYSGASHELYVVEGRKNDGKANANFADAGAARLPFGHAGGLDETVLTFDGGRPLLVGHQQVTGVVAALLETNGALDPSYGDGGAIVVPGPTASYIYPGAAALDTNGDLLVVFGYENNMKAGIFRLKSNGSLDLSFGTSGYVTLPGTSAGAGIAIDSSHRIVTKNDSTALRRFSADGKPDVSFGSNGTSTAASGFLALEPDGKIIIASGSPAGIVIHRYNP